MAKELNYTKGFNEAHCCPVPTPQALTGWGEGYTD